MDRERNSRPSLKRHSTLQRTPTFASLLCELRAQRPDLFAEWVADGEVGLVLAPIFTGTPEVVAAEFADKVLACREKRGFVRIYSPFLAENVIASVTEIALAPVRKTVPRVAVEKPRKTTRKRAPKAQRAEAA